MDIIIPLASTSDNNFLELRLALRSIAQCSNVGKIYIATMAEIPWIKDVELVRIDDPYKNDKDKNLIRKVLKVLEKYPEIQKFIFTADDCIFNTPMDLNELPDIYNERSMQDLMSIKELSKWQRRLLRTMTIVNAFSGDASCNWDSHCPIIFNRDNILDRVDNYDWASPYSTYTICTLFAYLCDKRKDNGIPQATIKETFESARVSGEITKPLIGYNEAAFNNGLREILLRKFNKVCHYEKSDVYVNNNVNLLIANLTDVNKLQKLLNNTPNKCVLFPMDKVSYDSLRAADLIPVDSKALFASSVLLVARLINDVCVAYDGNYDYPDNYIVELLTDKTTQLSAVVYDSATHRGIVNNSLLSVEDISKISQDANLHTAMLQLVEIARPSVIIRENELY